jgi:glucosamine kinase
MEGALLATGTAGPSGLGLGIELAWQAILVGLDRAWEAIRPAFGPRPPYSRFAIGMGLAGVNQPQWREAFLSREPGFGRLVLESDAFTSLLGAHGGQPGGVLAVGTGSVGLAWWPDGRRQQAGGWGFPSGDEGSGAWLGLQLVSRVQWEVDGRAPSSALGRHAQQVMDEEAGGLKDWLAHANQTRYAALAPVVVAHAHEAEGQALLAQAARHVARLGDALDPQHELPWALCGGLAPSLEPWLPAALRERLRPPQADSSQGALWLAQQAQPKDMA